MYESGKPVLTLAEQKRQLVREKLTRELGPTILKALEDPKVVEIMLNPDGILWVDVLGEGMRDTGERISAVKAENLLGTIASMLDITIGVDNPILQCELPLDGSRVQGVLPPVSARPTFAIRKRASLVYTLDDYVSSGILNGGHADVLREAVRQRKNILIVGSTGSGKTTLANALLHEMSIAAGADQRIVVIEDTVELQCSAPNHVALRTSDAVDMTRCLKVTMRLRPDRIVVGEVRDHAALALLKAWNTGHPGGLSTLHANSAAAGLLRLEQLIAESRNVLPQPVLIAEAVDLIAFITRTASSRRVTELVRTGGVANGEYVLTNIPATETSAAGTTP
ncbi:MAG: P-type conjugative transfer ATPase TrbB [Candidatus Eremiobacteraeota bacterium]|nr:P-type conjugative transfer ATPase TrbB [Candidatus Eremiobacteraeota bacterium]